MPIIPKKPAPAMIWLLLCLPLFACGLPPTEPEVDYQAMFVQDRLVEWQISLASDDWQALLLRPSQYVPADIVVDGTAFDQVGLRLVGNLNRAKMGMRIRFDEFNPAHRFHGVKRVNLRNSAADPSLVREALALHLMRQAGLPAPRSSLVWVDWGGAGGVYTLVEQVDRRFLEDRFGEDEGNLYGMETGGNLVYQGDDPAAYDWEHSYQAKTNEQRADGGDLIGLMKILGQADGPNLAQDLDRSLDLDGFLQVLAINQWLANLDSYAGSGRNFYLYRDRNKRFRFIPWDLNRAFGNYHGSYCRRAVDEQACLQFAKMSCQQASLANQKACTEQLAELCAEHPDELCPLEFWEQLPTACLDPYPGCELCAYSTDELLNLGSEPSACSQDRPLVQTVLAVPALKQRYQEHMQMLIDGVLAPAAVIHWLDLLRDLLAQPAQQDVWRDLAYDQNDLQVDFDRSFTDDTKIGLQDDWSVRVPGLLPFIQARDDKIRGELGGL